MQRTIKSFPLEGGGTRWEIQIQGEPCIPKTVHSKMEAFGFIRTLVSTPGLLDCGNLSFDSLKMHHDGTSWVVILEAADT